MEEIDLMELWEFIKKKSKYIILTILVMGLIGFFYSSFLQVPKFKSTTSIVLVSESNNAFTNNELTLNQNLVGTYTEIIKSKKILNPVIYHLDLDYKYAELFDNVSVSSDDNSQIIKITVTSKNAVEAKLIADEIGNNFRKEIPKLYKISNVNILDNATIANEPFNINVLKETVIFILIGLVLSVGIVFLIYYFDRTVKSVEQVESRLKLPILATIQSPTKEKKSRKSIKRGEN